MRIGKVKFDIAYIVDLDDKEMVQQAQDMLIEDIDTLTLNNDVSACVYEEVLPAASEADINDYLWQRKQEREQNG